MREKVVCVREGEEEPKASSTGQSQHGNGGKSIQCIGKSVCQGYNKACQKAEYDGEREQNTEGLVCGFHFVKATEEANRKGCIVNMIKALVKVIIDDLDQLLSLFELLFARLGGLQNCFWGICRQNAENAHLTCQAEDVTYTKQKHSANGNAVEAQHRDLRDHSNQIIEQNQRDSYRKR